MMFLMMMMLTLSIIFPWMKHPLSMGMILMLQTMMISIFTGMMVQSFWFSYMLFIILLGGMLVLFIYMSSIASNEKFHFSMKIMLFMMLMIFISIIMQILLDPIFFNKIKLFYKNPLLENEQTMTLIKLFNMQSMMLTIMLITYLLITMIAITYITNIFEGPMRMKN